MNVNNKQKFTDWASLLEVRVKGKETGLVGQGSAANSEVSVT